MNILITGNLGYVGPIVTSHLREAYPDATLIGVDTGYFADRRPGTTLPSSSLPDVQYMVDIREMPRDILKDIDSVVHLAAISNDPIGERYREATYEINYRATITLAESARSMGVQRFVFASSCSVYGFVEEGVADEDHRLNPLTPYAYSKMRAEEALYGLANDAFCVTCLRFATACGASDNLRLDLVLNDFVAHAVTKNEILILSDGSPVRPLVHVQDMARAIRWAIERDRDNGDPFFVTNVGRDDWNFRVRDLARHVSEVIPGVSVRINGDGQPDRRSYSVSFERFKDAAPSFQPSVDLAGAIDGLYRQIVQLSFDNGDFRQSRYMRLVALEALRKDGLLDDELRWRSV